MKLGPKAVDCLRILAVDNPEMREARYVVAALWWSKKAVIRKLEELARRGYIEYGVSPGNGWLTEKGRAALEVSTR